MANSSVNALSAINAGAMKKIKSFKDLCMFPSNKAFNGHLFLELLKRAFVTKTMKSSNKSNYLPTVWQNAQIPYFLYIYGRIEGL